MSEPIGAKANYTPHNSEQRKLFGNVEHLTRTAIPGPLVHLDPLRPIELVVSLQRVGKYQRPVWRSSQEQKGLAERALRASQ
jgi:hypothetical protein